MRANLSEAGKGRLERSCARGVASGRRGDRIRIGCGADGIERLEAHFLGQAFAPHRHDTYAIGITVAGVQTFRYRGAQRHCLPGQCHILHPDEAHDGAAGTDDGFGYRIVYIDPALIQQALGGRPLPFVPDPVIDASALPDDVASAVRHLDDPIDDLARTDIAVTLADTLQAASSGTRTPSGPLCLPSLLRVRDLIAAHPAHRHPMAELERLAGLDRWTLARQFRKAFGTSPGRFRTMRQLDHVRRLLRAGTSLAGAAIEAGFADQSHMTRKFKRAYGLPPGRWLSAAA